MKKIISLLATKKGKIAAGVLAVALVAGGVVAISGVVSAQEVWTAFLSFFGKANVTGNVWQSVLVRETMGECKVILLAISLQEKQQEAFII